MHTAQQCKIAVSVLVYLMVDFVYAVIRFVKRIFRVKLVLIEIDARI